MDGSRRTAGRRHPPGVETVTLLLALPVAAAAQPAVDNLRILTYNTAFMYVEANLAGPPPGPVPCATGCNPLGPPAPLPCTCPSISLQWHRYLFADVEEKVRAERIAGRILATDQDIVVLNEVFDPEARAVFETMLGLQGPYKHYVSRLKGVAPVDFASILDALNAASGVPSFVLDLSAFLLPYHPVNNGSGLMLFSKYPLLPLTGPSTPNDALCGAPDCAFGGRNGAVPLSGAEVVFQVFGDCSGFDCLASKGVGLVKIDTPRGPSYVAFTHLQADDENWPARKAQYEEIAKVLTGAIPPNDLDGGFVYLAGDLNTRGSTRAGPQGGGAQEWHDLFDPASANPNVAAGLFACGNGIPGSPSTQACRFGVNGSRLLTDAWGFETSTTDVGNGAGRLDYILHSSVQGRLCMQHVMNAWDLQADPYGDGGLTWLSDHFPVRADFGLAGRYCSPNDDPAAALPTKNVRDLSFGPTNCAGSGPNPPCHQDEIVAPPEAGIGPAGAFQWFRIEQFGTYSIKTTHAPNERVAFDVYHHTDLSRPILPFDEEETRWGTLYSFPDPPYYIRTFAVDAAGAPDRTARARDYTLKVHQHLCRKPIDACVLEPGLALSAPYEYLWPTTVQGDPLTELRTLYWRFKTSGVEGGRLRSGANVSFPDVRIQVEAVAPDPYDCITSVPPVLEEYDDGINPSQLLQTIPFVSVDVDPDDHDWDEDGIRDDLRIAPDLPGKVDDDHAIYFLKLVRDSSFQTGLNFCNSSLTSFVSFHTDLTWLVPTKVVMYAELDDDLGASDDMRVHMGYDASGFQPFPPQPTSADIELDEPDHAYLHGHEQLRGWYVSQVWPTFWETDENEHLDAWAPYQPFTGIPALSSWYRSDSSGMQQLSDGGNPDSADYYYILHYAMCHMDNVPACSNPNVPPP